MNYLINENLKIIKTNPRVDISTRREAFPYNSDENLIFYSGALPTYWTIRDSEVVELSKFEAHQEGLYNLVDGEKVEDNEIITVDKPSDYHKWDGDLCEWVEDVDSLRNAKLSELDTYQSTLQESYTFDFVANVDGVEYNVKQGISATNQDDLNKVITTLNTLLSAQKVALYQSTGNEPTTPDKIAIKQDLTQQFTFRCGTTVSLNLIQFEALTMQIATKVSEGYFKFLDEYRKVNEMTFDELLEYTPNINIDGSDYDEWTAEGIYTEGDKVSYNGVDYLCNHWTQGQVPSENVGGTEKPWSVII